MARPDDITLGDADLIPLVKKSEQCDSTVGHNNLSVRSFVFFFEMWHMVFPSSEM